MIEAVIALTVVFVTLVAVRHLGLMVASHAWALAVALLLAVVR